MKVYLSPPPGNDRAIKRVVTALAVHAPSEQIEFVSDWDKADVYILHVIGRRNATLRKAHQILHSGKQYVVIQYCVRSTLNPKTQDWAELWMNALLVWSYYDLPQLCKDDGMPEIVFPFYHAPLGVDPSFYIRDPLPKRYKIMTHGSAWTSESVREVAWACKYIGKGVLHLGPEMGRHWVTCIKAISDEQLSTYYGICEYVAGLRRTEGFELPAAEGLLCGARPIMYDRPHYRKWFDPWAVFIPETEKGQIIRDLQNQLQYMAIPPTEDEILAARAFFNWRNIAPPFWHSVYTGTPQEFSL